MTKVYMVQSLWERDHEQVIAACLSMEAVEKVAKDRWRFRGSPTFVFPMQMVKVTEVDTHIGEDKHAV